MGHVHGVQLGRGEARAEQTGDRLDVRLADGRVSQAPAAIRYVNGSWVLRDHGSRNVTEHPLGDGDVVEGRAHLLPLA
jgi:pSer/pThr/pTyr-binding forkhead associated (FHA) protein